MAHLDPATPYRRAPLARGTDGEPFPVPPEAFAWRVRRFRNPGRPGACELVYGDDAAPLEIGIDTPISEFKEAVGHKAGRYRLDAIDGDGVAIPKLPPAYLQIDVATEVRNGNVPAPAAPIDPTLEALREVLKANAETLKVNAELARTNAELARTVIERFPAMMDSAATLVRAADGAGLPQRTPVETRNASPAANDNDTDAEEGDEIGSNGWPTAITQMVNQLLPMVQAFLAHRMGGSAPRNSADADAPPPSPKSEPPSRPAPRSHDKPTAAASDAPGASDAPPAVKPRKTTEPAASMPTAEQLAHFAAVQAGLTAREAQIATALAVQLKPAERAAWLGELAALPVPDAVALIRRHLAQTAPAAPGPHRELGVRKPDNPASPTDDSPNPEESH